MRIDIHSCAYAPYIPLIALSRVSRRLLSPAGPHALFCCRAVLRTRPVTRARLEPSHSGSTVSPSATLRHPRETGGESVQPRGRGTRGSCSPLACLAAGQLQWTHPPPRCCRLLSSALALAVKSTRQDEVAHTPMRGRAGGHRRGHGNHTPGAGRSGTRAQTESRMHASLGQRQRMDELANDDLPPPLAR